MPNLVNGEVAVAETRIGDVSHVGNAEDVEVIADFGAGPGWGNGCSGWTTTISCNAMGSDSALQTMLVSYEKPIKRVASVYGRRSKEEKDGKRGG
jgi:hypothetical protein